MPVTPRESDSAGGLSRTTSPGIFPVVTNFQVYMVARLSGDEQPSNPDDAAYRPRLYYLPAVVLWNPYDRTLVAEDGLRLNWANLNRRHGWGHNFTAGTFEGGIWRGFSMVSGGEVGKFPHSHSAGSSNTTDLILRGTGDSSLVLPPGESRVFTMTQNLAMSPDFDETKEFVVEPGFRNFGFYLDAEDAFVVERAEMEGEDWQGIFLDVRSRIDKVSADGTVLSEDSEFHAGFTLALETGAGDRRLQSIKWLLLDNEGRREANRPTIGEIEGAVSRGGDPNGSAPVQVTPGDLREGTVPALDADDSVSIGYDIGLRIPAPNIELNDGSYRFRGSRPLASHNPRAPINEGPWPFNRGHNPEFYQQIVFQNPPEGRLGSESYKIQTWDDDGFAPYFGYSDMPGGGSRRSSLFHLPEAGERLRSLGQLRHLDMVGNDGSISQAAATNPKLDGGPAFVFGEARADPYIPLNQIDATLNVWNNRANRHADHQWLANRQIWDRFFVSTVPPDADTGDWPPPNGRMDPVRGASPDDAALARMKDARTAAAELWVDGAFNINSVSLPAWKALLRHFFEKDVTLDDGSTEPSANAAPFVDLPNPFSGPYRPGPEADGADGASAIRFHTGYRQLSGAEIDTLAREIVRLIKERGPFASLADFVNRSIRPEDAVYTDEGGGLPGSSPESPDMGTLAEDPRMFGLLQAAIERAGLNDDFYNGGAAPDYVGMDDAPWDADKDEQVPIAAIGPFLEGAPGYLTQGKLLQRLGPILSARSDTFRIRGYGETRNPATGETARARCEAIVQRMPGYVDPANAAETRPDEDELTAVNRRFGRQFRIVAFRWMEDPGG